MARKKYRFTLPNGENAWTTGETVADALSNAFKKYRIPEKQEDLFQPEQITLKEFVEKRYRPVYFSSLKPKTIENYNQFLKLNVYPFLGDMFLDDISVTDIQKFYIWMANASKHGRKNDLNERTIARIGSFLSKIFCVAVDLGLMRSNPVKKTLLKNPGRPATHHKPVPREEMDRIKKKLPSLTNERGRLYMTLLVYTGMRPEEILGMRWEHIHIENPDSAYCEVKGTVVHVGSAEQIIVSDTGKTAHALRIIPLPKPAVQILKLAICKEGYVLGNDNPLSKSTYKRICDSAFQELEIKGKYCSYDFRTTYGTELCEAGLTSKQVGDLMGHADSRMVETVYARSRPEGILRQIPLLNKLNQEYEI